jgi:hypothetical protein
MLLLVKTSTWLLKGIRDIPTNLFWSPINVKEDPGGSMS